MILFRAITISFSCLIGLTLVGQPLTKIYLQDNPRDEAWVDRLNDLSQELLISEPQSSLEYINTAIHVADSLNYQKGVYIATINKGSRFWMSGLYDQALAYYYQAEKLGRSELSYDQARIYNNMAESYKQLKNYDSADLYFQKAISLVKKISGNKSPAMITYNRGELFYLKIKKIRQNDCFEKAWQWRKKTTTLEPWHMQ